MKNMYRLLGAAALVTLLPLLSLAQSPGVGIGTAAPDVSAALDIVSSTKGALLPRVADATALVTPATGLLVFQTGSPAGFYYNAGTPAAPSWQQLNVVGGAGDNLGNHTATQSLKLNGNTLSNNGTGGLRLDDAGMVGIGTAPATNIPLTVLAPAASTTSRTVVAQHANLTLGPEFAAITDAGQRIAFGINNSGHAEPGAAYFWNYANTSFRLGTNNTERLRVLANGNVGIGNTSPSFKLHVSGNVRADMTSGSFTLNNFGPSATYKTVLLGTFTGTSLAAPQLRFEGVGSTQMDIGQDSAGAFVVEGNDAPRLVVQRLGNVGIGTSTPTQKLEVAGNTVVSGSVGIGTSTPTQKLEVVGNTVVSGSIGIGNTAPTQKLDVTGNAVVSGNAVVNGNVGIGVSPSAKLHVNGNLRADLANGSFNLNNFSPTSAETVLLGTFSGTNNTAAQLRFGNVGSTYMDIGQDSSGAFVVEGNDTRRLTVQRLGNVGIGTISPTQKLDVAGNAVVSGNLGIGNVAPVQKLDVTGNAVVSGRIGVGITTPGYQLTNTTVNTLGANGQGGNSNSLNWAASQSGYVGQFYNGDPNAAGSGLAVKIDGTNASATALDVSKGAQNTTGTSLLVVKATGNVGIGTSGPSALLDVNGSTRLRGLAGTGNRLVTVDASGNLSSSTSLPTGVTGDNLGNHAATQNIGLNNFDLRLLAATNTDHGLGWYGTGKLWDGLNVNGPVLYGTSGGVLGTVVSGVQKPVLTWKTGGNVGIGTNAPTQKLDVTGNTNVTGNSYVSGNVGIGTSTPTQALDVRGNLRLGNDDGASGVGSAIEFVGPGVNTDVMGLYRANIVDNVAELRVVLGDDAGQPTAEKFVLGTTNVYDSPDQLLSGTFTPRFTVVSDGSTGIGEAATNPTAKLDVDGSTRLRGLTTAGVVITDANGNLSSTASLDATTASNGLTKTGSNVALGGTLTQATTIANSGFNLNVTGTGNMGIGTTAPVTTLDVRTADATAAITVGQTNNTAGALYFGNTAHGVKRNYAGGNDVGLYTTAANVYLSANGTSTSQFVLTNSGNVGIGTAPGARLHVAGTMKIDGVNTLEFGAGVTKETNAGKIGYETFTTATLDIVGAGTTGTNRKIKFWAEGGAIFTGSVTGVGAFNTSDARFKQHVRPLNGALASVLALRGVRYDWNALGVQHGGKAGAEQVGLIAQEVEILYPELVSTDADGYKAVNYAQLAPVLIEAIKELKAENEALKAAAATSQAQTTATLESLADRLRTLEAGAGQARK